MIVSVILGHPYSESLNAAIAARCVDTLKQLKHTVRFHDLYQEGFDPVIRPQELVSDDISLNALVKQHCNEIREADGIVIVHPNWWGMPPAILKGWVDRVLRPGVAYAFDEKDSGGGVPIGLLKAKAAVVLNTSNTAEARENSVFGDPLETIWKNCIFDFCGVKNCIRKIYRIVADSTPEIRDRWLTETAELMQKTFG